MGASKGAEGSTDWGDAMRIRKPRRDMSRPQAPVKGYEGGWRRRWDEMETDRDVAALIAAGDLNGAFKRVYRRTPDEMMVLVPRLRWL